MTAQLDLFAPPPAQRHSLTSIAAAEQVEPSAPTLRQRVLDLLIERGPMTDEEMQEALGMNPSTQRPRRVELWRAGLVRKHPDRGVTRAGRAADRWFAA